METPILSSGSYPRPLQLTPQPTGVQKQLERVVFMDQGSRQPSLALDLTFTELVLPSPVSPSGSEASLLFVL